MHAQDDQHNLYTFNGQSVDQRTHPRFRPRFRRCCRSACMVLSSAMGSARSSCLVCCSRISFIVEARLLTLFTVGLRRVAMFPSDGCLTAVILRPGELIVTAAASTAAVPRFSAASGIVPIFDASDKSLERTRFRGCCAEGFGTLRALEVRRPNGPPAGPSRGPVAKARRRGGVLAWLLPVVLSRCPPLGTKKGRALTALIALLVRTYAHAKVPKCLAWLHLGLVVEAWRARGPGAARRRNKQQDEEPIPQLIAFLVKRAPRSY